MTDPAAPRGILVITGTGTGVGKTVVTAAVAVLAQARGARVAVVKPAQTGSDAADAPDVETVERLSGVTDTHEFARFPDPLSPEAAARTSGLPPLDMDGAVDYVKKLARSRDLVLVEGAGGLLVRYDPAGRTIASLASALGAPVLVVTAPGLGTLNHTALTCEALAMRGLRRYGVVIGSWPRQPGLAELENLADLRAVAGEPLAGVLPEGAGILDRAAFLAMARVALAPHLGGERPQGLWEPEPGAAHPLGVTRARLRTLCDHFGVRFGRFVHARSVRSGRQ
ncbi:dethiobiotin synthase [Trebonia sp.]|uniref:dethiobiotin synthase n=1 Tax=Trebonia sp. TaxID=2767075 RepID=UPI00262E4992|nr:dethiobiotin synthase [Trebonia sp.]